MKRLVLSLVAAVALVGGRSSTASAYDHFTSGMAQDVYASTTQLPLVAINDCTGYAGCDTGCDSCGDCCSGGCYFEVELLFLQYLRADGLRVGDDANEQVNGNLEVAPRISLGYISSGGLGTRIRYFEFEHSLPAVEAGSSLDVNTFTIDVEAFERFALTNCWDLEGSFGVRYNEFAETLNDNGVIRQNRFNGFGLITGLELRRQVACGALYGRVRQAILSDDLTRINAGSGTDIFLDSVVGVTEINIGYELSRELACGSLLFVRTGAEYQLWSNFSSAFDGVTGEAFWDGAEDAGFSGFSFSGGMYY